MWLTTDDKKHLIHFGEEIKKVSKGRDYTMDD